VPSEVRAILADLVMQQAPDRRGGLVLGQSLSKNFLGGF
jgi:hypothetical protein